MVILYSKPVLNIRFKGFWYTKINLSQKYISDSAKQMDIGATKMQN